jgi:hypothetical protein
VIASGDNRDCARPKQSWALAEVLIHQCCLFVLAGRFGRYLAELVQKTEEEDRKVRSDHMEVAIDYKYNGARVFQAARTRGLPGPDLLPHPDDIIIDLRVATVRYAGPCTPEDRERWLEMRERRDEAKRDVTY